jgi:hypothetical protein
MSCVHAHARRLGDQLVSWDGSDGLASAIAGALSGGLSGMPATHSDIGGYNSVTSVGEGSRCGSVVHAYYVYAYLHM